MTIMSSDEEDAGKLEVPKTSKKQKKTLQVPQEV